MGQRHKPFPEDFHARFAIAFATHKAAELSKPTHRLTQRWNGFRQCRRVMDLSIERLPFFRFKNRSRLSIWQCPAEHRGVKNSPGNDAENRQSAFQASSRFQLSGFNLTFVFENCMKGFNPPSTAKSGRGRVELCLIIRNQAGPISIVGVNVDDALLQVSSQPIPRCRQREGRIVILDCYLVVAHIFVNLSDLSTA